MHSLNLSLTFSHSHSLFYSLTHLFTHSYFHSLTIPFALSLLTISLAHLLTNSHTHSFTCLLALFTRSFFHSGTIPLARSLTISLTHSLLCALPTGTCSTTLLNAITHKLSQTSYLWPLTLEWLLVLWLQWRSVAGLEHRQCAICCQPILLPELVYSEPGSKYPRFTSLVGAER